MDDLTFEERLLQRAASSMAYPPTPMLQVRVLASIATPAPQHRRTTQWLAAAMAAVAAMALVVVLSVPSTRSAVAEFFGVKGSKVVVLPTPAPGVTPTPFPTPVGLEQIAHRITMDDARLQLGFAPPLPAGAGEPGAVYLVRYFDQIPAVVLQFDRYDLWVLRPDEGGIFQKGIGRGTTIEDTSVLGQPARWIAGGSHIVTFTDASGREALGSQRTVARNTLIWGTTAGFYRIETDLPEVQAIAFGATLP